jgi:hypothetical protein
MENQELPIVDFELAKLLKEKNFNWLTDHWFDIYDTEIYLRAEGIYCLNSRDIDKISAPTLALAQQWLREKHNICIVVMPKFYSISVKWTCDIYNMNTDNENLQYGKLYSAYDEALLHALKYAVTLI